MNVALVIGTRPEAIKLAPVIKQLEKRGCKHTVIFTGQHKEMAEEVFSLFSIAPQHNLNIMQHNQTPLQVASILLDRIDHVLEQEKPDWVLVQGDTTTAMAAAIAAYYKKIPVGHVEAGLRTKDKWNPFPEEGNRAIIGRVADVHFAPTLKAKENLLKEGVDEQTIHITGNTVIDALLHVAKEIPSLTSNKKNVLVTAHRRENFGENLRNICAAVKEIAMRYDTEVIFPVHPNPEVRATVHQELATIPGVSLIPPQDYKSFVTTLVNTHIVLTDSGGIQEEAPSLGKPVLVLREETERGEIISSGNGVLVGTNKEAILRTFSTLWNNEELYQKMSSRKNPYGDGRAAEKILDVLWSYER